MCAECKTLLCELHTCAPGHTTKPCTPSPRPEPVTAPPRVTLLLKDSDGTLETWDPFSRRRLAAPFSAQPHLCPGQFTFPGRWPGLSLDASSCRI